MKSAPAMRHTVIAKYSMGCFMEVYASASVLRCQVPFCEVSLSLRLRFLALAALRASSA